MISIPMYARVTEPIGKWYINGKSLSDLYVPGMSVQNDCHLAGFPLFVGSKVETTTLHTEHFGEFGVKENLATSPIGTSVYKTWLQLFHIFSRYDLRIPGEIRERYSRWV